MSENNNWFDENIVHPAANTLKESANAGINLLNVALSPAGTQIDKYDVKPIENATAVQSIMSGVTSAVPYVLSAGVLGRALRFVPEEAAAASVLRSESFAQIGGAFAFDTSRDVRPGETKFGNMLGSVMGFGTYELGNWASGIKEMGFARSLPLRFAIGATGGSMQSVFSDLGSFRTPDIAKIPESAITSGGMNVVLPTLQAAVFRGLGIRSAPALPVRGNDTLTGSAHVDTVSSQPDNTAAAANPLETMTIPPMETETQGAPKNGEPAPPLTPKAEPEAVPLPALLATGTDGGKVVDNGNVVRADFNRLKTVDEPGEATTRTATTATPKVDLREQPGWAVYQNYLGKLKADAHESWKKDPEFGGMTPREREDIKRIVDAQRNIDLIADGNLSEETQDYIKRGWLPANTPSKMQQKLVEDLSALHRTGGDSNNVADLAVYKPKFVDRDRIRDLEAITGEYQGSTTRMALKAVNADSQALGDIYGFLRSLQMSASGEDGITRVHEARYPWRDSEEIAKYQRAIKAAERSLANPDTRAETLARLNSSQPMHENLIDALSTEELGFNRTPAPIDLAQYPAWDDIYSLLRVMKYHEKQSDTPLIRNQSAQWASRSLMHIEQIARGEFPEPVAQLMKDRPDILNQLQASLERDLSIPYRDRLKPFSKENPEDIHTAYQPLLQKYERSSMYRYLQATDGVPPQLERTYNNLRAFNPGPERTQQGLNAIYAMERGLLDPQRAQEVRDDLTIASMRFGAPDAISIYNREYHERYADRQEPTGPSDYSTVVAFPRRA